VREKRDPVLICSPVAGEDFFLVVLILILNSFQAKPYGLISFSSLMVGISNGWD
jgi:hypothetical protein